MKIDKDDNAIITVQLDEDFDFQCCMACIEDILKLIDQPSQVRFIFDTVQRIDSSGIGALLALRDRLPESSPRIQIINPPKEISVVLGKCHLNYFFNICSMI